METEPTPTKCPQCGELKQVMIGIGEGHDLFWICAKCYLMGFPKKKEEQAA